MIQLDIATSNYKVMQGLGYLDQKLTSSDLGRILNAPQVANRPGRPVVIPLSYEDMQNVDKLDDSKLVFKKVSLQGFDPYSGVLMNFDENDPNGLQ